MNEYRDRVSSAISNHRNEIKKLGVRRLGVFGSVSRGDMKDTSDIDILVEFETGKKTSIISWTFRICSKAFCAGK